MAGFNIRASLSAKLIALTGAVLIGGTGMLFSFMKVKTDELFHQQMTAQARILFQQILLTRRWIADHDGIFVKKLPGAEPNPYLSDNEIESRGGDHYLRENPALVTRHLAAYARRSGYYRFNLTSLKPINPANQPDGFEKEALKLFAAGKADEYSRIKRRNRIMAFRYIAPLYTESACIKCHPDYRIGEVRGALSISIPVDRFLKQMRRNRMTFIAAGTVIIIILFIALFIGLRHFVLTPLNTIKKAMNAADPEPLLTDINNRDEIGLLAATLAEMRRKIKRSQNLLEQKIAAATAELRQSNRRYRELSERKSDFIARISHELRTPMTSVRGAAEYLIGRLDSINDNRDCDRDDLIHFAGIIASNAGRMERMVNETLDLEKIETGRAEFNFVDIDPGLMVRESLADIEPLFESRNIRPVGEITDGMSIHGDNDRLKDMISNLVVNGFDHSPEGTALTVSCRKKEGWAEITVKDCGPGIAPELQAVIFDRFRTGRKDGTGLGLALCRAIAEAHGGDIRVKSTPGRGACFIVNLPLREE